MTAEQLAYIERRRRQIRYWPFMAAGLVIILLACYAFLFIKAPLYVSPSELLEQLRAQKLRHDDLVMLAALGNLAFIGCGFFIFALILLTSLSLWNESRLIRILLPAAVVADAPASDVRASHAVSAPGDDHG